MTSRESYILPILHRLVTDEYGENYWFNGCARYVMECLGGPDYDYWFFAGLTGDLFTPYYVFRKYMGDALSSCLMDESLGGEPAAFVREIFSRCGYAADYVANAELKKDPETRVAALKAQIDRGVPVIAYGHHVGVWVGYKDRGKTLLLITGNSAEPREIPLEEAMGGGRPEAGGWIYVGEKTGQPALQTLYREAIRAVPRLFGIRTPAFCAGTAALRAWAADIAGGAYDRLTPAAFDTWPHYTTYVCVLATNGSCAHAFLKRAKALNPDLGFLDEVIRLYSRTEDIWHRDAGRDLEALGGGFNVTLETLQNPARRGNIAAKILEAAECMDRAEHVILAGFEALDT